jgi:hypothetical protein
MPTNNTLAVRKAVVAYLKAYAPLTALIAADHIHGERAKATPPWPFILLSPVDAEPFEAQGWDGSEHRISIHAYVHGTSGFTDEVIKANAAIVEAMSGVSAAGLGTVDLQWVSSGYFRDTDEQNGWHGVNLFDWTVAA